MDSEQQLEADNLQRFDPELHARLISDMDYAEIRGSERVCLLDWLASALVNETILSLYRKGMIRVDGIRAVKYSTHVDIEPLFHKITTDENSE